MDEFILKKLGKVAIGSDEADHIQLDDEDIRTGLKECSLSVIAHTLGGTDFNIIGFKKAMCHAWNIESFGMQIMENKLLQILLDYEKTVKNILSGGSWNFENQLVLLRPWKELFSHDDPSFEIESFWIHIVGLPRYCYTIEVGVKLAKIIGTCTALQIREEIHSGSKFFCIRTTVKLLEPLRRCVRVTKPDGSVHPGLVKYERLPTLCFYCGVLGHRYRICPKKKEDVVVGDMDFGPWMGGLDNVWSDLLVTIADPNTYQEKKENDEANSTTETNTSMQLFQSEGNGSSSQKR